MMKYFLNSAVFVMCLFFLGCMNTPNSKEEFMSSYKEFVEEVKQNKNNYSKEEWDMVDEKYKRFTQELRPQFEDEFSMIEQGKLFKYSAQFTQSKASTSLGDIFDGIDGKGIEDAFNEFKGIFNDDIQKEFDDAFVEMKAVWNDELKDDLASQLNEINKVLESGKVEAELENKIDEVKKILEDEDVKKEMKKAVSELHDVLEKLQKKLEEK